MDYNISNFGIKEVPTPYKNDETEMRFQIMEEFVSVVGLNFEEREREKSLLT